MHADRRSKAAKGDAAATRNEWKEKKAAAEKVSELIKDQLILCGDVSEVVGVLKSYAGHSNINVVIAALNALGALCDRLAKDFAHASAPRADAAREGAVGQDARDRRARRLPRPLPRVARSPSTAPSTRPPRS